MMGRPRGVPRDLPARLSPRAGFIDEAHLDDPAVGGEKRRAYPAGPALAVSCLLLAALAWHNRFIQDDAFISFHYASRLVEGHGLTWLPGERVEGYTNFLWTLVMCVPLLLRIDPILFAQVLGVALFVGTLLATYGLARTILDSPKLALLAIWLLGTNYTFSAYATGGLETQLQALFVVAGLAVAYRVRVDARPDARWLACASLLCAGALLTRLDSAIPFAAVYGLLVTSLVAARPRPAAAARALAALVLPALLLVGAWLVWKVSYYGDVMPNTFYTKTGTTSVRQGVKYLWLFVSSYGLLPVIIGVAFGAGGILRQPRALGALLVVVLLWCVYVARVGGDFMEFRPLVPVLPLAMILVVWLVRALRPLAAQAALVATLVVGSFVHAVRFGPTDEVSSVLQLARYVDDPAIGWIHVGRVLGTTFGGGDPPVLLASTAAGAIPFYSRLPTLDMHGLTDRWVARHGVLRGTQRPGHQRIATLEYMLRRRVYLVIGHPLVQPLAAGARASTFDDFVVVDGRDDLVPPDARFVVVPLGAGQGLTVLCLARSAAVDRAIVRHGLRTYPARRS